MFNKNVLLGTVAGAAIAFASIGYADGISHVCPHHSIGEPHFYVGAGIGYGDAHLDNASSLGFNVKDGTMSANIYAGYAFNDFIAAQLGYTYFNNGRLTVGPTSATVNTYAIDFVGRLTVPVPYFTPLKAFALLGVSYLNESTDRAVGIRPVIPAGQDGHFGVSYGAGLSYRIVNHLDLIAKWQRFSGEGMNNNFYSPIADSFTIGGEYHFA